MVILTSSVKPSTTNRLLTIADVAVFPDSLPTGDVDYELFEGELVIIAPPDYVHATLQTNLAVELKIQGERRGLGKARPSVGVILGRNPDTLLVPDALFITSASLPIRESPEGYLETIPELIVEVRSPSQTIAELERKANQFLNVGTVVVWVIDRIHQCVRIYRAGQTVEILSGTDTLTVPDVIPGFTVSMAAIFAE